MGAMVETGNDSRTNKPMEMLSSPQQTFGSLSFELAESGREGAGSPPALLRRGCIAEGDRARRLSLKKVRV